MRSKLPVEERGETDSAPESDESVKQPGKGISAWVMEEKELSWTLLRALDGDLGHLSLLLTRSQDSAVSLLFSYM